MTTLEDVDLNSRISRAEEEKRLAEYQQRLLQLRLVNGGQLTGGQLGPPVCIVFEGWDASGKGGAIKRLVAPLDPRHVRVASFAAPTGDEKRHHFLWRFYPTLPGWGGMAILDRSWYGRVLVERVEQLATEDQWRRAYDEIAGFERSLALEGMVLVKLWLHISHDEQLRRFERREAIRSSDGNSAPRTGATGRSATTMKPPSRTCSPVPTTNLAPGTSSPRKTSATPGSACSKR